MTPAVTERISSRRTEETLTRTERRGLRRGEFLLQGFRNRDIQEFLYPHPTTQEKESRRHPAAVSQRLRLLRAHRLIGKVPHPHRYHVTELGRHILPAVPVARKTTLKSLNAKAE
jgi:hypothetical protein